MNPQSPAPLLALSPCPWCGDELVNPTVSEGSTFRWRKVDGCCTDGPEVRHNTLADDQAAAEIESTAAAIEAWNHREPDPAYWQLQHTTLLTAYNELLAAKRWLPIESAPVRTRVLVVGGELAAPCIASNDPARYTTIPNEGMQYWYLETSRGTGSIQPTHWQPLPPTPGSIDDLPPLVYSDMGG